VLEWDQTLNIPPAPNNQITIMFDLKGTVLLNRQHKYPGAHFSSISHGQTRAGNLTQQSLISAFRGDI
jgi:hypothetical protein